MSEPAPLNVVRHHRSESVLSDPLGSPRCGDEVGGTASALRQVGAPAACCSAASPTWMVLPTVKDALLDWQRRGTSRE